ncbi:hypothetical protein, partial [Terrimonas alba]|uniref:hypothetical protein n=1 Tax=Terrimonas alba TaxID=3349636 RepID=UPI0035F42B27
AAGAAACAALTDGVNDFVQTASFPDVIGNPGKPTLGAPNVDANIACFESYIKPNTGGVIRYGDRTIEIRGNAAISNVTVSFIAYQGSGKDLAEYLLEWTSSSDIVMIRFATRLAAGNGTCGYGSGQGAGSISGGPYHVTLERLDDVNDPNDNAPEPGVSLGSQDNQIMSNAIQIPAPTCGLTPGSSGCTNTATSFNVTYSSTDAAGATVKFYFTSNTAGAKLPNGVTAVGTGDCANKVNFYSVVADVDGNATIAITPSGTAFTAGSFKIGACVTTGSGTTTCEQATATVIDEASVVAKVDGNVTTAQAPATLNSNQANPSAALTAEGTLNGTQDNSLFSSFTWAAVSGNNATNSNLSSTSGASVTFTPTALAAGGFVTGLYIFEVTATSTANSCVATARVYIDVTGGASCPGVSGPTPVCANSQDLTYTAGLASPGDFLTYVWSLDPANGATIDGANEGVSSITVDAGTGDFTVILKIRAANGTVYDFANCHYPV